MVCPIVKFAKFKIKGEGIKLKEATLQGFLYFRDSKLLKEGDKVSSVVSPFQKGLAPFKILSIGSPVSPNLMFLNY